MKRYGSVPATRNVLYAELWITQTKLQDLHEQPFMQFVNSISRLSAVNVVINTPLFVRVLTRNQSEIDSFGSVASQVGLFSRRTCSYDSHSMVKQTFPKCV